MASNNYFKFNGFYQNIFLYLKALLQSGKNVLFFYVTTLVKCQGKLLNPTHLKLDPYNQNNYGKKEIHYKIGIRLLNY